MFINRDSALFSSSNIDVICKTKNATYVCDTEHKDILCSIFHQKDPKEGHNEYFALYYNANKELMITDGSFIKNQELIGVVADNGEVIFTRYRQDYRTTEDGSVCVDGGRAYLRCPANADQIKLILKDGMLQLGDLVN
jgi:hypothetical protein